MPRIHKILIRSGSGAPTASDFSTNEPAWDNVNKALYVKASDGTMASISGGPTGPAGQSVTGPTGSASTVAGPTGPTGPAGSGGSGGGLGVYAASCIL